MGDFQKSATSGAAQKNADAPGGGRRGNDMLQVAQKGRRANVELLQKVNDGYVVQSPERRAADWLEAQVAQAKTGITIQMVELTPALAQALLNRNPGNRRITQPNVDAMARDIRNGAWALNGQTIVVARTGELNDGQHRCLAVIDADQAIRTALVVGVERETNTTLDQGRARTVADYLGINGYVNSIVLAAAAGYVWQYQKRQNLSYAKHDRPTKTEIVQFVDGNPELVESVNMVSRKEADLVGGKSILAFCHFIFQKAGGAEKAKKFISDVMFGEGLVSRDPAFYARNRLMQERGRLRPAAKAEILIKCWNAWLDGQTVSRLVLAAMSTGKLPKADGWTAEG